MELYLMRHGIAEPRSVSGIHHDADRALTRRGAKKVRRIAKVLRQEGISFDLVLSSPFRRAKDTAEGMAKIFVCQDLLRYSDNLKIGGDPTALMDEISRRFGRRKSILVVGHEPYLSTLTSVLLTGGEQMAMTMKKGSICKLTVSRPRYGRCATLEWLVTPAHILGRQ